MLTATSFKSWHLLYVWHLSWRGLAETPEKSASLSCQDILSSIILDGSQSTILHLPISRIRLTGLPSYLSSTKPFALGTAKALPFTTILNPACYTILDRYVVDLSQNVRE